VWLPPDSGQRRENLPKEEKGSMSKYRKYTQEYRDEAV